MINLRLAAEQTEFADSVAKVARRADGDRRSVSAGVWKGLAEVGLLGLCAPVSGGSPLDLVAAMEALGEVGCGGPIIATCAAAAILDDVELGAGRLVTFTDGTLVPWGDAADLVLSLTPTSATVVAVDDLCPVPTLSGERWMSGRTRPGRALGDPGDVIRLAELALGSYLLGTALGMVSRAADHARDRTQFGRPIGDFQAVAHPLARSRADLRATQDLVRTVARCPRSVDSALASRCRAEASRVACIAAERVHQAVGAMGFAVETGMAASSMQIRQWSTLPICAPL
jgi:alkylation response protein AidB-like acyl-CoA dehydrogenase